MIVEDLGAWTTRAGIGHLPEIIRGKRRTFVIANTDDSIFRHTHHVTPQCVGLIVSAVHRHQQTFGGQLPNMGQQLPSPRDRFLLKIITKRPITEHLKESVMTCCVTNRIQVIVLTTGT